MRIPAVLMIALAALAAYSQQLPPEAVLLDKVKIAETITASQFDPVLNAPADAALPGWTHDGVAYGAASPDSKAAFDADPGRYAASAEKERWMLNFMIQMSPIWCPVTDEIGPGNMLTWEKEGLLWESCCTFCDQTVRDDMFPRAKARLRKRAEAAFVAQGARYVEGASSPVEGAINFDMEPSDRGGEPVDDVPAAPEPAWLADAELKPTFTEGVGLVIENRCLECHRTGGLSPIPLESIQDIRRSAVKMREAIEKRTMPPWPADPAVGAFANSKRLTDREKDVLLAWIDARFPMGEGTYERSARWSTPEWSIGEPDLVIELPPVEVPAEAAEYIHTADIVPVIAADAFVVAAEILPTDRFLVHAIDAGSLGAYYPGESFVVFEAGRGMALPIGASVPLRIHYVKDKGYAENDDATRIGLRFGAADLRVDRVPMRNEAFVIPPGAANHEVVTEFTAPAELTLAALRPVMLGRGKDVRVTVVTPEGGETPLLAIPQWDPKWTFRYVLADPVTLSKGAIVRMTAHFDNSEANINNPDPDAEVRSGADGEVMEGWLEFLQPMP